MMTMIRSQGGDIQQGRNQVEPAGNPQTQIDEGDIEGTARGLSQRLFGRARGRHPVSLRLQTDGQRLADGDLVVDDQDGKAGVLRLNHKYRTMKKAGRAEGWSSVRLKKVYHLHSRPVQQNRFRADKIVRHFFLPLWSGKE
jgi:hypothetical protein